ncbi:MAG: 2,3-bisphosphoglycerate-independent phosphoglycerate mutase, partial [Clostridiales bacterium]|nr:2,3-bisphosphoglycerate-independent phosphoglycerate mutase [Candidatus Apopatousia equi]
MEKKVALMVLDGFGYTKKVEGNAVLKAKTPFFDELVRNNPTSFLRASGKFVGLKNGQMGNSETGHMNIGAGRIVRQELTRIDNAITSGEIYKNKVLIDFFNKIKKQNGVVHFLGLLSNGGTHSHMDHLFALIKMAKKEKVKDCYVHVITDGRDTDMKSAVMFIKKLEKLFKELNFGKIVSIQGRFYGMDRDKHYDYILDGYNAIIKGVGIEIKSPIKYLLESYKKNITDEFIVPAVVVDENEKSIKYDNEKDGLLFYNFRKDRTKELSQAFILKDFKEFERDFVVKNYITMINYGDEFKCENVFKSEIIKDGLVEMLTKNGKKVAKFAEPTKYAHVTYFLNGGREEPFENESWFLVPAKKVKTYDLAPEMSALEIADKVIDETGKKRYDFVMLNLANCDMVGHTGNFDATIKAVETVDKSLSKMVPHLLKLGYEILITADHGNAEQMIFRGKVCTTHSNNPVRLVYLSKDKHKLYNGTLVDLTPTILNMFNILCPKCYT